MTETVRMIDFLMQHVSTLKSDVERRESEAIYLRSVNDRLRTVLRLVEWQHGLCPICQKHQELGHDETCRLFMALSQA